MAVLGGAPTDLFSFAIYYYFPAAFTVFVFGCAYRFLRMVALWRRPVKAEPRYRGGGASFKGLIKTFLDPIIFSAKHKKWDFVFGLIFLHLLGVIPIIFLLAQHMAFFAYLIPPYRILWPFALPLSVTSATLTITSPLKPVTAMRFTFVNNFWGPLSVILNGDVLAILAIVGASFKVGTKIYERCVKKLRNARITDILVYALLLEILFTGYLAARHFPTTAAGTNVAVYDTLLGLHVLGASTLLALLPFTKYWHFIFGYWYGKLHEWWDLRVQKGAI
ncbi:MAG: hypothetical protein GXO09_02005 [Crenarchaeota archaeon]|nr:hypothetical protein [Thermoproteota archaeon]